MELRMVNRYSFKNRIFRAGFYIFSIGGLMMLFAGLLCLVWNHAIVERFDQSPLNFLESAGLVSVAYIVYSAIRFSALSEDCTAESSMQSPSIAHNSTTLTGDSHEFLRSKGDSTQLQSTSGPLHNQLSDSQREQLKREIERCCGKSVAMTAAEPSAKSHTEQVVNT